MLFFLLAFLGAVLSVFPLSVTLFVCVKLILSFPCQLALDSFQKYFSR